MRMLCHAAYMTSLHGTILHIFSLVLPWDGMRTNTTGKYTDSQKETHIWEKSPVLSRTVTLILKVNISINFCMSNKSQVEFKISLVPLSFLQQLGTCGPWVQ